MVIPAIQDSHSHLFSICTDPVRARRVARLARAVGNATKDEAFLYIAYAIETHQDMQRYPESALMLMKERDSYMRTAIAQQVPAL
jgi:hypothetical protein